MSTVNQDELKAINVLKFTGKESEWKHWSEKFVALARARGFAGIPCIHVSELTQGPLHLANVCCYFPCQVL